MVPIAVRDTSELRSVSDDANKEVLAYRSMHEDWSECSWLLNDPRALRDPVLARAALNFGATYLNREALRGALPCPAPRCGCYPSA